MEQFERAQRYLIRMRAVYAGVLSGIRNKDDYEDDVISFFVHCYHIRDWIVHLSTIGITASVVDAFIDEHEELRICADMCNGSKHCKLTRSLRTDKQPHMVGKTYKTSVWQMGNGGGEAVKARYSILTSSGIVDALELAEKCMKLWSVFIEQIRKSANVLT